MNHGVAPDHPQQALVHLRDLRACVEAQAARADVGGLVELIGYLDRAIQTFHMESIRLRMYTMGRTLSQRPGLPAEVGACVEQVSASLEAAGFHTRSVAS